MNQFYSLSMKTGATRALKAACFFSIIFLSAQQSMAQSANGKSPGDLSKTASSHPRSFLEVHPNPDRTCITVGHPAGGNETQLKLVDTHGKILQQVAVTKNSLQTKLNITGLSNGNYKIVWSDGAKTVEQPLLIL